MTAYDGISGKYARDVTFRPFVKVDKSYRSVVAEVSEMDSLLGRMVVPKDELSTYLVSVQASEVRRLMYPCPFSEAELRRLFLYGKPSPKSGATLGAYRRRAALLCCGGFGPPFDIAMLMTLHKALSDGQNVGSPGEFEDDADVGGLEALLDWTNSSAYDAVTTATVFLHRFLVLHPFGELNIDVAQVMFVSILSTYGLPNAPMCGVLGDAMIGGEIVGEIWREATGGEYGNMAVLAAERLHRSYERAVVELDRIDSLKTMDPPSARIVGYAGKVPYFKVSDAASWSGLGEQSARDRLSSMVAAGVIDRIGMTKGMRFSMTDPLGDMRRSAESVLEAEGYMMRIDKLHDGHGTM